MIALSLMVSPLWLMTARRLQTLTAGGIWRLDDLLLGIYEKETRLLARGSKTAARRGVHMIRLMRAWLTDVKIRAEEWRRHSPNSDKPINDDEAAPLSGEVLPPEQSAYKRRA